jgi:ubiquinone/menaquinone biosynthesis C-methylase UbiE
MMWKDLPAIDKYIRQRFDVFAADPQMFPMSIDRCDWQWKAVGEVLGVVSGRQVLDIGCGKGRFSLLLAEDGAVVTGIDISEVLLGQAKRRVKRATFYTGSVTAIPVRSNSFDSAICIEVLEHVPDLRRAIAEMARVLKRGGKAVIIDKNILGLHSRWNMPAAFYKFWMEQTGHWFYPKDTPFRERWFTSWGLSRLLRHHFRIVEVRFLERGRGFVTLPRKILPWMSYDIRWVATK